MNRSAWYLLVGLAFLTKLTQDQADYIGVAVEGPFKSAHYRN